jgi:hypothetical protein
MCESTQTNPKGTGRAVATLVIGLVFIAVGTEALAAYNSCIADPACLPSIGALNVGAFFGVLVLGIAVVVGGLWTSTRPGLQGSPPN